MSTTRRRFLAASGLGLAGLIGPKTFALGDGATATPAFRICFFTDPHLPYANTLARLTDDKFHHQKRIRAAFDRANSFKPDAYVFGGDHVFAVDQGNDGGNVEANVHQQFDNWKAVVAEKVNVPNYSIIGNHDIWYACPKGTDPKACAIAAFGMPNRYYSWSLKGWKFIMLDVFGIKGSPLDAEQMQWLEAELKSDLPICVVTHAPILSLTVALVGGGIASPKVLRELFFKHPNVRLALSGHNHMVDACTIDQVTYICGGAVSGSWWEGAYEHFPPAFVILDLQPDGAFSHQTIFYENA